MREPDQQENKMKCVIEDGKKAVYNPEEEEIEFTEKFKEVENIYKYYEKMQEERKDPPEKLKIVILEGKEVAFNPEEDEDPRLVKAIMEAEKEETFGPYTYEEFHDWIEREAKKDDKDED